MMSINNGHPTLKFWCWAIYPFLAVFLFVLHTVLSVSRRFRMLSILTENVAQQLDLIAAVNVVCKQTISYAEHTENVAQQSDLFAAVNAVCWAYGKLCLISKFICCSQNNWLQSMSSASRWFRMLGIQKTLHSSQIYLLQSMPYAEHKYGKLFSVSRFFCCLVSRISKAYWPPIILFWLTITVIHTGRAFQARKQRSIGIIFAS